MREQAAERTAGAHRLDIAEYLSVSKNAINVKCLSFFLLLKTWNIEVFEFIQMPINQIVFV